MLRTPMYNITYIPHLHKVKESGGMFRINIKLYKPCNKYTTIAISVKVIFVKEAFFCSRNPLKIAIVIIESNSTFVANIDINNNCL